MKKIFSILFLSLLLFSCVVLPKRSRKIIQELEKNKNVEIFLSKEGLLGDANLSIKSINLSQISSLLPAISIETDKTFILGGKLLVELPIPADISSIYSGKIDDISLCYFNSANGNWEKINTKFDTTKKMFQAEIPSLKKDNLDEALSKILITLSFPIKEGQIANLYQQNKLIESSQGSIKNFFETKSEKNCIIIHGVTSSPENMQELLKTIRGLNYYENIIFYQYASGEHIKKNAEWLVSKINTDNSPARFDIIAHSMGGLVARVAIESLGLDKNVNKLIMIGTPNNGGNLSEFIPIFFPNVSKTLAESFPGVQDLVTNSDFYRINKEFEKNKFKTKYYCLAGEIGGDGLVKTDTYVSVASATFLHIESTMGLEKDFTQGHEVVTMRGWKYYHKLQNELGLNLQYEHSNLHVLSSENGVKEQLNEWIME